MKPFTYLTDEIFLSSCLAYGLNRWVLAPGTEQAFLTGYFNDLLLLPCALPVMLWIHRLCGLKHDNLPPGVEDILLHLAIWSVVCEWIGPHFVGGCTADPMDVLAYATGAVIAGFGWRLRYHQAWRAEA